MSRPYRSFASEDLRKAWTLFYEYQDFHRLARHRQKLEEKFGEKSIPWKSLVQAVLSQSMTIRETDGNETNFSSQKNIDMFLNDEEIEENFEERWFEINELKTYFEKAAEKLPKSQNERLKILRQILGYPIDFVEERDEILNLEQKEENPLDLSRVFPIEEQNEMRTGDIVEFTGNRLHGAFYVYRLPRKGLWSQIRNFWLEKSSRENFQFDLTKISDGEEILLIPAMDEYGRGVPYLFATTPIGNLPEGTFHKYVDINCPQIAAQIDNPTVNLVRQHLETRRKNPKYFDGIEGELFVELERFPQEYVAQVMIDDGFEENVLWIRCSNSTNDLNENQNIFYSRRILEAEEFIHQKN